MIENNLNEETPQHFQKREFNAILSKSPINNQEITEEISVNKVWQIIPGYTDPKKIWVHFMENDYVSIGFSDINLKIDLSNYKSSDEIFEKINSKLNDQKIKKECSYIHTFINEVKLNDIIVVTSGKNTIYGIGIVESEYIPPKKSTIPFYENLIHSRKVKWIYTVEKEVEKKIVSKKQFMELDSLKWNKIILKYLDNDIKLNILTNLIRHYRKDFNYNDSTANEFYKKISDKFNKNLDEIIDDMNHGIVDVKRIIDEDIILPKYTIFKEPIGSLKGVLMADRNYPRTEEEMKTVAIKYIELMKLFRNEKNEEILTKALEEFENNDLNKGIGLSRVSASLLYLDLIHKSVINDKAKKTMDFIPRFFDYDISLKNTISDYLEDNMNIRTFIEYVIEKTSICSYADFDQFGFWLNKYSIMDKPIPIMYKKPNKNFIEHLNSKGFLFDLNIVENYLLSLKVKSFVILSGNSGTGKTKLAQLFAQYLEEKYHYDSYELVAVGANWMDNSNILGFDNFIKGEYEETNTYRLIKRAQNDEYHPYFLILDEMNLSYVERYFADFLSALESHEEMTLSNNKKLKLPENLFVIGTVNVDETTYMFSPKVLDRANVLEFTTSDVKKYMDCSFNNRYPETVNISYLENPLININSTISNDENNINISILKERYMNIDETIWETLKEELSEIHDILKECGFDFGFRVTNEILTFIFEAYIYENYNGDIEWSHYIDVQILQKILPKLHGSKNILEDSLNALLKFCMDCDENQLDDITIEDITEDNTKYYYSSLKLYSMIKELEKLRYVSFIN